jgi:hypothetical protein
LTEKASYLTGLMVVINGKMKPFLRRSPTDLALLTKLFDKLDVNVWVTPGELVTITL